jgi:hypothetical protein
MVIKPKKKCGREYCFLKAMGRTLKCCDYNECKSEDKEEEKKE